MKHVMAIFILIILMVGCTPATPSAPPVAPPAQPTPPPTTSPAILPPTEAPPKIVEKATTFEAVKYTDPTYKFSVAYPAGWTPEPAALKGGVFYARGPYDDRVYIAVRPATNLREAAITFVNDFITATSRALVVPNIDSETTIALADGTKADVILLSAGFGQSQAGIAITGVVKDGNAIMICASRNPKNLELYKEIGSTLTVQTTTPNTSLAQPGDNTTTTDQATSLKVLFDRQGAMYLISVDGSDQKKISNANDMSPGGKTRVIAAQTDFNYRALYLVDADGTNKRPIIPIGGGLNDHAFPVWSPDGSKIAFSKAQAATGSFGYLCYDIWIINPDGSDIKKISNTISERSHWCPQWFPDSKKIVYASNEDGYRAIYSTPIAYYDSAFIVRLQQEFKAGWIPWDYKVSQDGKRLIYKDGPGTDLKTLVIDINSKKITEWPNIDTSEISPVKSQDGIVTVITRPDGLYYTDNSHSEPLKIPSTAAGDIAIKVEADLKNLTTIQSPEAQRVEIKAHVEPLLASPPVDIKTSFDAVTYSNETDGFSFKYPKGWVIGKPDRGQTIYLLAGESRLVDRVWVDVIPETSDIAAAVKASHDSSSRLEAIGKVVKIESSNFSTLIDGKTPCTEVVVSSQVYSGITLYGVAVGVNKDGKTVFITGATIYPGESESLMREIVRTLSLK